MVFRVCLPLLALALLACPESERGDSSRSGVTDAGADGVEWPFCVPGEVEGCLVEGGKRAMICNPSGTAFVEATCRGARYGAGHDRSTMAGRRMRTRRGVPRRRAQSE